MWQRFSTCFGSFLGSEGFWSSFFCCHTRSCVRWLEGVTTRRAGRKFWKYFLMNTTKERLRQWRWGQMNSVECQISWFKSCLKTHTLTLKHKIKLQIYEATAQTLHTLSRHEVRKELGCILMRCFSILVSLYHSNSSIITMSNVFLKNILFTCL